MNGDPKKVLDVAKESSRAPSLHIPNFVGQCTSFSAFNVLQMKIRFLQVTNAAGSLDYETSTFHHLSSWKLQYQRLVSQLNREKGPEFRPDESTGSSSNSDPTDASSAGLADFVTVTPRILGQTLLRSPTKQNDQSMDSSSISSGDIAAPGSDMHQPQQPVYMHLDMDAFYANVLINRRYPHLKESPVVVVPAKNTNNGTSEVASANYEARKYGIRARMFVSEARKLCDKLHVLQVDYSLIEDTSARMYEQILRYTHSVEAVSADEAYLDVTPWGWVRAQDLAQRIQNDVSRATHCPCSIGVGSNKLVARLSTFKAKPAGIVLTKPDNAQEFVKSFSCDSLPGVGGITGSKLAEKGIKMVSQLLDVDLLTLQSWFGDKTGRKLFDFSRAKDDRALKSEQDRKSVGTQISWGVRMLNDEQVAAFLTDMTAEVCKRLMEIQMIGARVTLRVLKKKEEEIEGESTQLRVIDARMGGFTSEQAATVPKGESAKAFNPGLCTQISKSSKLSFPTGDKKVITREILRLYKLIGLLPLEFRGAGISIDDLLPQEEQAKNSTIHSFFKPHEPSSSLASSSIQSPNPQVQLEPSASSVSSSSSLLLPAVACSESAGPTNKRTHAQITPKPTSCLAAISAPSTTGKPLPTHPSGIVPFKGKPAPKKQAKITSMFAKQPKT